MGIGELTCAANIFAALIANLDRRYVDEFEKARMYASVMFNYSTCLGKAGRRKEALAIVDKALRFDFSKERLVELPRLIFNKAYIIDMDNKKTESLPLFVLSYYGLCLFEEYGDSNNIALTKQFIFDNFNLTFDS